MPVSPTEIRDWTIYKITNPKARVYIGITSNFYSRMSCYKSQDKRLSRQTLIYNSMRKYGYDGHTIEVIDTFTSDLSFSNGREMFWVRSYMSNKNKYPDQNGLNLTDGGDGTRGYKPTPEMREKNRQSKLGKKQSPETIKKRTGWMKGAKRNFTHYTPEFRKMMGDRNRLYRHTDDAKRKIAEASKGNKYAVGYKMSAEQIEHRSSLLIGRKKPQEVKDKTSATKVEKYGKRVLCYDLSGVLLHEFRAVSIAVKKLGIPKLGIFRALSGKYKQSRGFIFKYKQP